MLSFKGKLMENVAEDDHGQSGCKIHENGLDLRSLWRRLQSVPMPQPRWSFTFVKQTRRKERKITCFQSTAQSSSYKIHQIWLWIIFFRLEN